MARSGIEIVAARALKAFLVSRAALLVSGMTSSNQPVRLPAITTSPATPPVDSGPFVSIMVTGRDISFANVSPLEIEQSTLRVIVSLESIIEAEADDDQPYERSSETHADIGDRIIRELVSTSQENRVLEDGSTGFTFKIVPGDGMQKRNSGASWKNPGYYAVAISEIIFSLRSACEQATY